ncbi:hypothetical protein F511_11324 [Dorcoceras hygrometricum]|uniref:Uncharacterized protein n=1 Tax=Dorcoceras hygrometricum TaxID=472368 RepID=A0A2Z7BZV5_9LAMI|nr:hypothetical protein F511_11324 [Dorcoceras hygrometricum]
MSLLVTRTLTLVPLRSELHLISTKPKRIIAQVYIKCKIDRYGGREAEEPMNNPSAAQRKKGLHEASRRSVNKKSFSQEQVEFAAPVSSDPVVGIIGGGMSGIVCALYLEKRGIKSTVFDTGIHGFGGRMGTRIIDPHPLIFDHAAQFFTVTDPKFAELVDRWSKEGLVRQWQGTVGNLESGGRFVQLPARPPRYIGINGMRPLADYLMSQTSMVNVVRPCWVSKLEPYNGMWHLSEKGKPCGHFDAIVIAHNGKYLRKCANRLLAASGLPLIARQMKRLTLSSIWALLAAFEDPLPVSSVDPAITFEGAFVTGVDSISWIANNTKKLLGSESSGPYCWTILSTATFGKQNKVPQESIPSATAEKVKELMLEGLENALGLQKSSLKRPFYSRLQLWGAALPTNSPGVPCIFDPHGRAGICGDWLLGSSIEAAALSGMAMANHASLLIFRFILSFSCTMLFQPVLCDDPNVGSFMQIADYFQSSGTCPDDFALGLHNNFQPIIGHDIGQFPGLESPCLVT